MGQRLERHPGRSWQRGGGCAHGGDHDEGQRRQRRDKTSAGKRHEPADYHPSRGVDEMTPRRAGPGRTAVDQGRLPTIPGVLARLAAWLDRAAFKPASLPDDLITGIALAPTIAAGLIIFKEPALELLAVARAFGVA